MYTCEVRTLGQKESTKRVLEEENKELFEKTFQRRKKTLEPETEE